MWIIHVYHVFSLSQQKKYTFSQHLKGDVGGSQKHERVSPQAIFFFHPSQIITRRNTQQQEERTREEMKQIQNPVHQTQSGDLSDQCTIFLPCLSDFKDCFERDSCRQSQQNFELFAFMQFLCVVSCGLSMQTCHQLLFIVLYIFTMTTP